ncbi:FecR [Caballeronia sordidicola]|uniref:FecR n=1 Tax=Caballeronia sordidicola TaxID=196367 RepID=A0A158FWD5_CABSO|nr:FecR domain-containing protein [Caballeronia sordidicola]SAL23649.1 FecR [Caballeronia sordidicola]
MIPLRSSDDNRPLDRAVARAAAEWIVHLQEGATPAQHAACLRWRAADPEHERAWERAQRLNAKFDLVPRDVGLPTLGRDTRIDRRVAIKALSVMLVAGTGAYLGWRETPWREWSSDERTATGERRTLVLADGTRLDLNTATAVDIVFKESERLVALNGGEILIETGRDEGNRSGRYRPFVVQTAQGRVRALGTRFSMRTDTSRTTRLAVLHGAVEITPGAAPARARVVEAGEQTRFTVSNIDPVVPVDTHAIDWSRGVISANGMLLGDFAAELARYRPGVLRCAPEVSGLRITGAFQIGNTDNILAALPQTLPVCVIYRTRYWVSIVAMEV